MAVLLLSSQSGASTVDDVCMGDPCTVSTTKVVTPSLLDFGARALVLTPTGRLTVTPAGKLTIVAGRLELQGGAKVVDLGGDVTIQLTGNLDLATGSVIDVSSTGVLSFAGSIDVVAGGIATLDGALTSANVFGGGAGAISVVADSISVGSTISVAGGGGDGDGGYIGLSGTAGVSVGAPLNASSSAARAGDVDLVSTSGSVTVGQSIDVSGVDPGSLAISAAGAVVLQGEIVGSGKAPPPTTTTTLLAAPPMRFDRIVRGSAVSLVGGYGSDVDVTAVGDVSVESAVTLTGSVPDGRGGQLAIEAGGSVAVSAAVEVDGPAGGGSITLKGCDLSVTGPLSATGGDGVNDLAASGEMMVAGTVTATGGVNTFRYLTVPPVVTGIVSPTPQITQDGTLLPCAAATTTTTTTTTTANPTTSLNPTTTANPTTTMSSSTSVVPTTTITTTSSTAAPPPTTTSTTSTMAPTTEPLGSSTTTAPGATTTIPSTTTPTTSTSSTSVAGPVCGNGIVEGDEQCDDGDPLSEIDCCNANCRYRASTTVCGAAPVGPCARASTCDGQGTCVPHVRDADSFECRPVGALDDCDLGDSCDGGSPDCPTAHVQAGCMAEMPDTVRKPVIAVKCEAILKPEQGGESDCEASGTDASAALLSGDGAAAVSGGLVTRTVRKTLKRLKNGRFLRVLKLRLNAVGKHVLRERGKLPVRVRVTINHGRARDREVVQLVTVVRKKKRK